MRQTWMNDVIDSAFHRLNFPVAPTSDGEKTTTTTTSWSQIASLSVTLPIYAALPTSPSALVSEHMIVYK